MESAPQVMPDPMASPSTRASSVLIGRQDYLSVLLRLTEMELYKIRRRTMSRVLSIISIIATISLFGLIALAAFLAINNGTSPENVRSFTEALRLPRSLALIEQLLLTLGLFTYAMMALFLSTLGRATATGLAGVLTWSFLIEPVIEVISNFGRNISGPTGSFFQSLPDYLIGTNISALLGNQSQYVFPTSSVAQIAPVSDLHALFVLAAYIVIFIGLAWWITMRRDVTN